MHLNSNNAHSTVQLDFVVLVEEYTDKRRYWKWTDFEDIRGLLSEKDPGNKATIFIKEL